MPRRKEDRLERRYGTSTVTGSLGSIPAIACSTSSQSAAVRARGPILSRLHDSGMTPCRLTSPREGRRPVMPQNEAGITTESVVSLPRAKGTLPAATAAPEPDEDPPDQNARSHGFAVAPVIDAAGLRYPPPPAS